MYKHRKLIPQMRLLFFDQAAEVYFLFVHFENGLVNSMSWWLGDKNVLG